MKRMLMAATVTLSVLLLASLQNKVSAQPRTDVSINYQTFYDELDPYGRWVDYPDQGYVWIPDAGADFQPYGTSGHWEWSDDYEWIWVSDYNWGWAPFHYGRWLHDPFYGWVWVPGYEWSPAWVAWRDGGDYYGWAPLRPGINISIGFNLGGYNPPMDYWCFTPRRYITHRNVYNYCAPRRNNVTIINQTTIINNYNYNRNVFRTGPMRRDAERYTGRINPVRFRDMSRPGRTSIRNNEVSIYRPSIQRDNNRSFAPRRVEQFDRNRATANNNNGNGSGIRGRENGNNLPQRREGTFDRSRSFGDNNGNRTENRTGERQRAFRDRTNDNTNQGQGNNNVRRQRTFERPEQNNNRPERTETPQRNDQRPGIGTRPRAFERPQGESRPERRQFGENRPQREQQAQPQFEQRQREQSRQMEQRRQEQTQQREQQSRQFEQRRSESRTESRGGGNGGGGNRGFGGGRRDR